MTSLHGVRDPPVFCRTAGVRVRCVTIEHIIYNSFYLTLCRIPAKGGYRTAKNQGSFRGAETRCGARLGVGQIVTFFAYRPPSRPLGSLTPTQPGRVTNPTQGHPEPRWEAPQAEYWLLRREPKPPA